MRQLSIDEYRNREIKILQYIDKICKENNLRYCVFFGTLLGAVRHKGFIPWDDDIDIVMSREDYELFLKNFKENEDFKVLTFRDSPNVTMPFIKVIDKKTDLKFGQKYRVPQKYGLFVDIFPYDNYPDTGMKRKVLTFQIRMLQALLFYRGFEIEEPSFKEKVEIFIANRHSISYWNKRLDLLAQKYDSIKTQEVYFPFATLYIKKHFNRQIFESITFLDFEGIKVPAPVMFNDGLNTLYGDYMKLPSKEKQVNSHEFDAFIIE